MLPIYSLFVQISEVESKGRQTLKPAVLLLPVILLLASLYVEANANPSWMLICHLTLINPCSGKASQSSTLSVVKVNPALKPNILDQKSYP